MNDGSKKRFSTRELVSSFSIHNPHSAINSHHHVRLGFFHDFHFILWIFRSRRNVSIFAINPTENCLFSCFSHRFRVVGEANWIFFSLISWQTLFIGSVGRLLGGEARRAFSIIHFRFPPKKWFFPFKCSSKFHDFTK
jgi:hypothetical protein